MVPDFYLVGDGKTGESAVIERAPRASRCGARRTTTLLTNHALSPDFAGDAENDRLRRYHHLGRALPPARGAGQALARAIDPRKALEILRDKKGAGGAALGLGNRNTLDALIATHSVVVDATALTLYVSESPHTLGRYRAFDLKRELGGEDAGGGATASTDLPEDALLGSGAYAELVRARELMEHARTLEHRHQRGRAIEAAAQALALAPSLPEAHQLAGDLWRRAGEPARARAAYERFLSLEPPYLKEVEEVKAYLGVP